MSRRSIQILDSTAGLVNVVGQPFKAAGYFGSTQGVHTVAFYLQDFTGRVFIDATLATDPQEDDWFPVILGGLNAYVQYPLDPMNPTGTNGDTLVDSFSFQGNFTFVRVRVDRSYLAIPSDPAHGSLRKILLNY